MHDFERDINKDQHGPEFDTHSMTPELERLAALQFKLQYSRNEVALLLGVGVRTVDRLIASKELPSRRDGGRVFVTRQALLKYLKRDHPTQARSTSVQ